MLTDQEKDLIIERQGKELERLRKRCLDLRAKAWELDEKNDKLHTFVQKTANLRGPGYGDLLEWNDGRISARPVESWREEWIRTFAAYALQQRLQEHDSMYKVVKESSDVALLMWNELEQRFEKERKKRAEAAAPEPNGEGEE